MPSIFDKTNEFSLRPIKNDFSRLYYKFVKKRKRFWLFHRQVLGLKYSKFILFSIKNHFDRNSWRSFENHFKDDMTKKGTWIVSRQLSLIQRSQNPSEEILKIFSEEVFPYNIPIGSAWYAQKDKEWQWVHFS